MKPARSALAAFAATGLAVTPIAAPAAPVRVGSPVAGHERFVGSWVMFAVLLGAVAAGVILLYDKSSDDAPTSP